MSDHTDAPPLLKVAAKSSVQSTASAIAHSITDRNREVRLRAVGAGAVNQAVKAITVARGFTATRGFDLSFKSAFETIQIDGQDVSAILFFVNATH